VSQLWGQTHHLDRDPGAGRLARVGLIPDDPTGITSRNGRVARRRGLFDTDDQAKCIKATRKNPQKSPKAALWTRASARFRPFLGGP
jgi:hypothetical protein